MLNRAARALKLKPKTTTQFSQSLQRREIASSITKMPHTVPLPGGIPPDHREHTEGTTTIIIPNENLAFLNPVQQYNRDLSVAVIRAWSEMRQEEAEARYVAKGARGADKRRKGKGKGKGAEEGEVQGVVKQGGGNEESLGAEKVTGVEKDTEPQAGPSRVSSCCRF